MQPATFPFRKLALFALLSAADFALTFYVLTRGGGRVYEANPIADGWLTAGGWGALAVFKTLTVAVVVGVGCYLYRRRPRVAHDVLALGCGVVAVAVITGAALARHAPAEVESAELLWAVSPVSPGEGPGPDDEGAPAGPAAEYAAALEGASAAVVARGMPLSAAVDLLAQTRLAGDPAWREALGAAYGAGGGRAALAADLLQHAVGPLARTPAGPPLAARLEGEFRALFATEADLPYRRLLHLAAFGATPDLPPPVPGPFGTPPRRLPVPHGAN